MMRLSQIRFQVILVGLYKTSRYLPSHSIGTDFSSNKAIQDQLMNDAALKGIDTSSGTLTMNSDGQVYMIGDNEQVRRDN